MTRAPDRYLAHNVLNDALRRCKLIPADIYFLADNTGSMGSYINAVKNNAGQILTGLQTSINDLFTGGGRYRDRDDSFLFQSTSSLAIGTSGAQSAINVWAASGGGDEPESQLYALYQASRLRSSYCQWPLCCASSNGDAAAKLPGWPLAPVTIMCALTESPLTLHTRQAFPPCSWPRAATAGGLTL